MLPSNTASPYDLREASLCDPLPDVGDHGSYAVYPVLAACRRDLADGDFAGRPTRMDKRCHRLWVSLPGGEKRGDGLVEDRVDGRARSGGDDRGGNQEPAEIGAGPLRSTIWCVSVRFVLTETAALQDLAGTVAVSDL